MDRSTGTASRESADLARNETGQGQKLAVVGGLLAAVGASSCCILPLVLFSLGVSGAWISNLTALARYQPLFIAAAVAFLGFGFWRSYRRAPACSSEGPCERPGAGRVARIGLWVATVLILAAVTFPYAADLLL
ncbi:MULTISPECIES: mercuric transporter MerT family protein [unclassified Methylobacterium]|jgi:mercuric ion transport protein|nr:MULTISPECIES: mercuric transporter MerT family protein [unclassified Methylobacterium]MBP32671.1 mercury transporter MerT [Methylobacterium sp.]MWV26248.1 mercury transporter MerT [Methylobacterium sp. 2A]